MQPANKRLVTEASLVDPASTAGALLFATFARRDGLVVNATQYGVTAGGVVDCRAGFVAALAAGSGGTVRVPPGTYLIKATGVSISIPANTTLIFDPGAKVLMRNLAGDSSYATLFQNGGDNVTIEGLDVIRDANFISTMIDVRPTNNFVLTNCKFDGNNATYAIGVSCFHVGGSAGTCDGLKILGTTVTRFRYGLYMDNSSTNTVTNLLVADCYFHHNTASDLELNSPSGVFTDVVVERSIFSDNLTAAAGAGWALGLANVQRVVFRDNIITRYNQEAVHIEDNTADVDISGNKFSACARSRAAYIYGTASSDIRIIGNRFDGTANNVACDVITFYKNVTGFIITATAAVATGAGVTVPVSGAISRVRVGAVLTFTGGGVLTVTQAAPVNSAQLVGNLTGAAIVSGANATASLTISGMPIDDPCREITIDGNRVYAGGWLNGISLASVRDSSVTNNRIKGAGTFSGGVYTHGGKNSLGFYIPGGQGNKYQNNKITGFYSAFARIDAELFGGPDLLISDNHITACNSGINALNAGVGTISGNYIANCAVPLMVGQGVVGTAAQSALVSGNHAVGCVKPMQIGKIRVQAYAQFSAGTGITVTLTSGFDGHMPSGTVVSFEGGAVLTSTATAPLGSTSITGNVTGTILQGQYGWATVPQSTSGTAYLMAMGNADSVLGAAGYTP